MSHLRKLICILMVTCMCLNICAFSAADEVAPVAEEAQTDVSEVVTEPEPVAEEAPVKEEEPAAEEPVATEPATEEPVVAEPAGEEPVVAEPTGEEPVVAEPTGEDPDVAEPTGEDPVVVEPTGEDPVVVEPTGEEPVVVEPTGEEPVVVEPTGEEPVVVEPTGEEPVVVEPTGEEPVVVEPTGEEPVVVEPTGEEPVAGEDGEAELPVEDIEEVFVEEEIDAEDEEEADAEDDLESKDGEVLEEEQLEVLLAQPVDKDQGLNTVERYSLEGDFTQKITFNMSSAGYFNLFIRWIDSAMPDISQISVRFMNANLTTTYLSAKLDRANSLAEISDWFDAGTYVLFVNIIADNGNNYWQTSYTVESKYESTSATANNGSLNSAANLPADGQDHNGLLSRTSNSRWWKISLSQAGFLEVDVRSYVTGKVESDVFLIRADQMNRREIRPLSVTLPAATPTNPQFKFASTWLEPGDYYVNVFAQDQQTGLYSLKVTFEAAYNTESSNDGTYLNANQLALDGATIRGLMSYTDEVDMYVFNVPDVTNVDLSVLAYMDSLNIKLYNSNVRTQLLDLSASGTGANRFKAHNHEQRIRLYAGNYVAVISRDPDKDLTGVYEIRARSTITIKSVNLTNGYIYNIGDTVTGNMTTRCGTPLEYYFHLQMLNPATGAYDNVSHITTKTNSFSFTPTTSGVYRILGQVTDGVYNDEWDSEPFTVKDNVALSVNSVDYNPETPVVGSPMTITPGIGGGGTVQQIIYEVYDSSNNLVSRIVTDGAPGVWTPTSTGTYKVMVVATDGITWSSKWGGSFTVSAPPALTISSIDLSSKGVIMKTNAPVTVTATVTGGQPIQYIYETHYEGVGMISRTTSGSNTFTFRPNTAGVWKVMVVATDGKQWTSKWSDKILVQDSATFTVAVIPNKTSVPLNGSVNFKLEFSEDATVNYTKYEVWNTSTNVRVDQWEGNSKNHTFAFATAGTYRVMGVVRSGSTWISAWSPVVTVGATTPLAISTITASPTSCYVNDVVTYTVNIGSGSPIQYIYNIYNSSNVLLYKFTSSSNVFKYQFKAAGTYKMMAVATDGTNWVSKWAPTVTVTGYGALDILRIDVKNGTNKTFFEAFTVSPVFTKGTRVTKIFYEVYNQNTGDMVASTSGKMASFSYQPKPAEAATAPTTYLVMIVACDDAGNWVSKWSDPIVYKKPSPALSIDSVTDNTKELDESATYGMIELGDSVEFTGKTKGGAAVFESEFKVYYNAAAASASGETLIDTVNTRNNESLLMIPANRGYYRVMYTAYDGITWASMYSDWIYVHSDAY